jgi:hypothetical protein
VAGAARSGSRRERRGRRSEPELAEIDLGRAARDVTDDHVERGRPIQRRRQTRCAARPRQQHRLPAGIAAHSANRVPRGVGDQQAAAARIDALRGALRALHRNRQSAPSILPSQPRPRNPVSPEKPRRILHQRERRSPPTRAADKDHYRANRRAAGWCSTDDAGAASSQSRRGDAERSRTHRYQADRPYTPLHGAKLTGTNAVGNMVAGAGVPEWAASGGFGAHPPTDGPGPRGTR